MSLTPEEVEGQTFSAEFRGYHKGEVDRFLDKVVAALRSLQHERDLLGSRAEDAEQRAAVQLANAEERARNTEQRAREADEAAKRRIAEVEAEATEALAAERMLKRTLVTAQRTADQTMAEATAKSDDLLAEAHHRAEDLLESARLEAETIRAEIRDRAADQLAEARSIVDAELAEIRAERDRLGDELQRIALVAQDYRADVRACILAHLDALDRAPLPHVPEELAENTEVEDIAVQEPDREGSDDSGPIRLEHSWPQVG